MYRCFHVIFVCFSCLSIAVFAGCGTTDQPTDNGGDVAADVFQDVAVPDNGVSDAADAADARDIAENDDGIQPLDVTDVSDVADVQPTDVFDAVADVVDVFDVVDAVQDVADATDASDAISDEGPGPCEDDGLECTTEYRGDDGVCVPQLVEGWCIIEDVCVEAGVVNPDDQCLECAPTANPYDWTVMTDKVCDDRLNCTLLDACNADGVCAGTPVACVDDGNSCTVEACSESDGACHTTTLGNGAACLDDGRQCTYDRCSGGVCAHAVKLGATCDDGDKCTTGDACSAEAECLGTPKVCAEDGNVCTENGCDPASGLCKNIKIDDNRVCEDYNWCTLNDGCRNGECTGDPQDCTDTDPCTLDGCVDGPAGYCEHTPILGSCEDGDLCTRGETCNASGVCGGGISFECNDFNNCTDDSCDSAVGCVFTPNYNYCDDNNPCTVDDVCDEDGLCAGTAKDCDDNNDCTRDYCYMGNCHHDNQQNGIACDDRNVCTTGGTCSSGACVPGPSVDCSDGDFCTTDLCDPLSGCYTAPVVCTDVNFCTDDTCDPSTGCVFTPNSKLCDDGDLCTEADRCSAGVCGGTPLDCSDGDPCTFDECLDGVCSNPTNEGDCDDGNACTNGERCFAGVCSNGDPVDCYDGSDCTADYCDPVTGCVNEPITGSCDDGTVCTLNDHCSAGRCVGATLDCSDGNECTNDLCHPLDGCYWENNVQLCDDANPCTVVDQCGGGSCQGTIIFRTPLIKSSTYMIGTDGNAGNGLDVDGDSGTCMPAGKCSNGIDNAFAAMTLMVKDQFNPDLVDRVASGDLAMFLEPELPGPVGSPFEMKVIFGEQTGPTSCNPATSGCNYIAFKDDTIGSCTPRYALTANTSSSHISAGGLESQAVVYFMIGAYPMAVPLKWARIEADVTVSGNSVTGGSGILAGAVNKTDFKYALASVPESYFSPYTRSQVILSVDQNLPMDADVDLNGTNESYTIGIKFTIVQGNVVGRTDN